MPWLAIFISLTFSVFSPLVQALEANAQEKELIVTPSIEAIPEVGKHIGANMDALTMIVSLLMVLAIIIVCAFILKRFQPIKIQGKGLAIVTSMSLGAKERLIVVQIGDKQQLLGVTSQQITLLDTLDKALETSAPITTELSQSLVTLVQKHLINKKKTTKEESV
jgi:flagellar protein FliO/FliZ